MNGYDLSRNFFDWCFENPEKVSPNHSAIYFFAIEHCNRLGWKSKFGMPTQMVMDAIGIKKHETYIRYFNDLIEWGFLILIQKSTNQYSSNIISINNAMPKKGEALGKASRKHGGKQVESMGESYGESNSSIDKPIKLLNNNKLLKENKENFSKNEIQDLENENFEEKEKVAQKEKESISGDLTNKDPKANQSADQVEIIKSRKTESLDFSQESHFKKPKNQKTKKIFVPPLLPEVIEYFLENGETKGLAIKYFNHYDKFNWVNSRDKPVLNWKQTAVTNWFGKDFNKKTNQTSTEIMKKQGQAQKEYFEKLALQQNG